MTNDKTDRKYAVTFGRFARKGKGKRAASKAARQRAKRDTNERAN